MIGHPPSFMPRLPTVISEAPCSQPQGLGPGDGRTSDNDLHIIGWGTGRSARAKASSVDDVFPLPAAEKLPNATGSESIPNATRLIFKRCRGEILSEVMFPPQVPQPSVRDGVRFVVNPTPP